jgi:glucose/arabinose dehydrogenase
MRLRARVPLLVLAALPVRGLRRRRQHERPDAEPHRHSGQLLVGHARHRDPAARRPARRLRACAPRSTCSRSRATSSGSTSSSRAGGSASCATARSQDVPRRRVAHLERRRARAARARVPPAVRDQPPLLRQLHEPRGRHAHLEFRATSPDAADASSERILLEVGQPFANHNGGGLAFDNAGRLLIALGDGGSGGDPQNNGQKLSTLLGKILRIDVDAGSPYGIPADNPFRATAGAQPEIWAYGLRNPFKIAIDRPTGDLYIGDVGQNAVEEIDVDPGSRRGGLNYGWRITEGSRCFNPSSGCDTSAITLPIYEYSHGEGCSVTGGVVYRGCRVPALAGTYFFADYCSALVRSLRFANGQATELRDWTSSLRGLDSPTSFGLDAAGELYVVDQDGEIYRLEPS